MRSRCFWLSVAGMFLVASSTCAEEIKVDEEHQASPTQYRQHRLRIAQNPSVGFTNDDVDSILHKITRFSRRSEFAWDVPCPVEFVREGDIINNAKLPLTGSADSQEDALNQFQPDANVLIVFSIDDCAGVAAAGCAPLGTDRMAVTTDISNRGAVVWLHERGHVLGRPHWQQDAPPGGPDTEWGRTMFWNPGSTSTGFSKETCAAFKDSKLKSVKTVLVAEVDIDGTPTAFAAPAQYGLTDKAFALLDKIWIENEPLSEIKALDDNDLESIRNMLKGSPNELWSRALRVIAKRGRPDDLTLLIRILSLPQAAPPTTLSANDRARIRTTREIILTVPKAVGELAQNTKSQDAVALLRTMSHKSVSASIAGGDFAEPISRQSVRGLAYSGSDVAIPVLNSATASIHANFGNADPRGGGTAALDALAPPLASDIPKFNEKESTELAQIWQRARK